MKSRAFLIILAVFFTVIILLGFYTLNRQKKSLKINVQPISHLACPYEQKVYEVEKSTNEQNITAKGIIIPHHLLARRLIVQMLKRLDSGYETIILIGPNHENLGKENIQVSKGVWQTKFGMIDPDSRLIESLIEKKLATIREENFETEHAICGLVSFLKIYFPKAKIVPLTLRANTTEEESTALANFLSPNCQNCLMVGSVDFSHKVSIKEAQMNDTKSASILATLDLDHLSEVMVDSAPTLRTLLLYLKEKKVRQGRLIEFSDASKESGQNLEKVTSYVTMVFE